MRSSKLINIIQTKEDETTYVSINGQFLLVSDKERRRDSCINHHKSKETMTCLNMDDKRIKIHNCNYSAPSINSLTEVDSKHQ